MTEEFSAESRAPAADESVWRQDLGCSLRSVVASLPEHRVVLLLAANSVADGRGAIELALDIDPHVTSVITLSNNRLNTHYLRMNGDQWECRDESHISSTYLGKIKVSRAHAN
jgi:hypothetical protein